MSQTTNETTAETPVTATAPEATPNAATAEGATEEPLRAPGLKALQAERDRAEKAESQLAEFEPYKKVLDGLQKLFVPDGAADQQPKPEDMISQITQRLDAADRKAAVNEVARKHGITSDDDIALLDAVSDPAQREALAARLHAGMIPPDPGQGVRQSTQNADDAEYQQFFPSTRK